MQVAVETDYIFQNIIVAGSLGTSNFVALQIDDEERKLTIER